MTSGPAGPMPIFQIKMINLFYFKTSANFEIPKKYNK